MRSGTAELAVITTVAENMSGLVSPSKIHSTNARKEIINKIRNDKIIHNPWIALNSCQLFFKVKIAGVSNSLEILSTFLFPLGVNFSQSSNLKIIELEPSLFSIYQNNPATDYFRL